MNTLNASTASIASTAYIYIRRKYVYNMGTYIKLDRVEKTVAHMVLTIAAVGPWTIISTIDLDIDCWPEAVRTIYISQSMSFVY